jgi:hypothetical protein
MDMVTEDCNGHQGDMYARKHQSRESHDSDYSQSIVAALMLSLGRFERHELKPWILDAQNVVFNVASLLCQLLLPSNRANSSICRIFHTGMRNDLVLVMSNCRLCNRAYIAGARL